MAEARPNKNPAKRLVLSSREIAFFVTNEPSDVIDDLN
jgi:hypothetical protein